MLYHHLTSLLTVIGLFALGLLSPGPNFFTVVDETLTRGRRSGIMAGLGTAAGDAIYASAGLLGMVTLIKTFGTTFLIIRVLGGLYLSWIGLRMLLRARSSDSATPEIPSSHDDLQSFRRGLLTDLANPKTIIFFASIFSFVLRPETPAWLRIAMLLGIISVSILWRGILVAVFSAASFRKLYERVRQILDRCFGGILAVFGLQMGYRAAREAFRERVPALVAWRIP